MREICVLRKGGDELGQGRKAELDKEFSLLQKSAASSTFNAMDHDRQRDVMAGRADNTGQPLQYGRGRGAGRGGGNPQGGGEGGGSSYQRQQGPINLDRPLANQMPRIVPDFGQDLKTPLSNADQVLFQHTDTRVDERCLDEVANDRTTSKEDHDTLCYLCPESAYEAGKVPKRHIKSYEGRLQQSYATGDEFSKVINGKMEKGQAFWPVGSCRCCQHAPSYPTSGKADMPLIMYSNDKEGNHNPARCPRRKLLCWNSKNTLIRRAIGLSPL